MDFLKQFLLSGPSIHDLLISFALVSFTGLLISQFYCFTRRDFNYEYICMALIVLKACQLILPLKIING